MKLLTLQTVQRRKTQLDRARKEANDAFEKGLKELQARCPHSMVRDHGEWDGYENEWRRPPSDTCSFCGVTVSVKR